MHSIPLRLRAKLHRLEAFHAGREIVGAIVKVKECEVFPPKSDRRAVARGSHVTRRWHCRHRAPSTVDELISQLNSGEMRVPILCRVADRTRAEQVDHDENAGVGLGVVSRAPNTVRARSPRAVLGLVGDAQVDACVARGPANITYIHLLR